VVDLFEKRNKEKHEHLKAHWNNLQGLTI